MTKPARPILASFTLAGAFLVAAPGVHARVPAFLSAIGENIERNVKEFGDQIGKSSLLLNPNVVAHGWLPNGEAVCLKGARHPTIIAHNPNTAFHAPIGRGKGRTTVNINGVSFENCADLIANGTFKRVPAGGGGGEGRYGGGAGYGYGAYSSPPGSVNAQLDAIRDRTMGNIEDTHQDTQRRLQEIRNCPVVPHAKGSRSAQRGYGLN